MKKNAVQQCHQALQCYCEQWEFFSDRGQVTAVKKLYDRFFCKEEYQQGLFFKTKESRDVLKEVLHNFLYVSANKIILGDDTFQRNHKYGPLLSLVYGLAVLDKEDVLEMSKGLSLFLDNYEDHKEFHVGCLQNILINSDVIFSEKDKGIGAIVYILGSNAHRKYHAKWGFKETLTTLSPYLADKNKIRSYCDAWGNGETLSTYANLVIWEMAPHIDLPPFVFDDISHFHSENADYIKQIPSDTRYYVHLPITHAERNNISDNDIEDALIFFWSWVRPSKWDTEMGKRVMQWMIRDDKRWNHERLGALVKTHLIYFLENMYQYLDSHEQKDAIIFIKKYASINNALDILLHDEDFFPECHMEWKPHQASWQLLQDSGLGDMPCSENLAMAETPLYGL